MRALVLTLGIMAVAAPAAAQDLQATMRAAELQSELSMQRQRSVALENEVNALDARVRTEQALRQLELQRYEPRRRTDQDDRDRVRSGPSTGGYVSMPDDRLAASNARVRDAAQSRR